MINITIKVEGLDELQKKVDGFSTVLNEELQKMIAKIAFVIEAKTKPFVPVKTGFLRSQTRVWEVKKLSASVESRTFYAPYVHKRKPYFIWGLSAGEGDMKAAVETMANDVISKVFKK